ncbi:expressed unknown protein [Seminavis robusta]|uniref:Uncharacterized protein n=1 Tax=Seminavis robusta TaxID=568900 RepID=A0A9N8DDM7_9STRA|nr:expressed unknown protein [Seminavis robusta]|eukprot:Sro46_g027460.1 n/a (280) ;mRNA; r:73012-73851
MTEATKGHSDYAVYTALLHKVLLVASFLNCISHLAVILNVLQQGLVLFIFVGVLFDCLTSLLYMLHHMLTLSGETASSSSTIVLLVCMSWLDLGLHLRALVAFCLPKKTSLRLIQSVVHSAHNNLQGIPGKHYEDHIFAFADTAKHLTFFMHAMLLHDLKNNVILLVVTTLGLCLGWHVGPHALLRWVCRCFPLSLSSSNKNDQVTIEPSAQQPPPRLIVQAKDKKFSSFLATCNCPACQDKSCFVILPKMCELWFCTFEELLHIIDQANHSTATIKKD